MDFRKFKRVFCALLVIFLLPTGCAEASLTGEQILQVEQALYSLGYHDDDFDALLDEDTRKALRAFQRANGLEVTGEADSATLGKLSDGTAITCHEYLVQLTKNYSELPILQMGSTGNVVSTMQRKLKELGYFSGSADGVFGEATLIAVYRFQIANGLDQTGTADQSTLLRLNEGSPLSWDDFLQSAQCAAGDSGQNVRTLQRILKELGYFSGDATGNFGDLTQQAVLQFQANNSLEETGEADQETCGVLYSGSAVAFSDPDTLELGDASAEVTDLQSNLAEKGYFDHSITGIYGATTETAVRLFQLANGIEVTGDADADTVSLLQSNSAVQLFDVYALFVEMMQGQDDSVLSAISSQASRMRGQSFEADDEDLYPGFAFVQYICVYAGIPVSTPEDLMEMITETVEDTSELEAGEIVALCSDDETTLAISSGDGRVIYATAASSWVLESDLRDMDYTELLRWNMTA